MWSLTRRKPHEDGGLENHMYNSQNRRGHQQTSRSWKNRRQRDQVLKIPMSCFPWAERPSPEDTYVLAHYPAEYPSMLSRLMELRPIPRFILQQTSCSLLPHSQWNPWCIHCEKFLDLVCSAHRLISHKHWASSTVSSLEHQSMCHTTSKVRKR